MRELAYAGFGVFHDEAIVPAVHARLFASKIQIDRAPQVPWLYQRVKSPEGRWQVFRVQRALVRSILINI